MPPKRMRKDVEEAVHLRNQQLMNAALRGDVEEVTSLIERGADVVGARDIAPFSKGDKLSVLAALLLQGTFSKETLAVAQVLLRHGASLNDVMPLPNESHFAPHLNPLAGALDTDAAAAAASSTVAVTTTVSPRQRPTSAQRTRAATPMSNAESRTTLPDAAAGSGTTPATTLLPKKANARTGTTKANDEDSDNNNTDNMDQGTVLHYLVALGDHTHLMQLLMMAGQPTNTLPHSLLRHVELFLTALTNYAATGSMTNMDGTASNNNNSSSATNAAGAEGKAGAGGNISARSTNTAAAAGAHSGRRASRVLSPRGSSSRGGPRGGNNANNAANNNSNTGGGGKEGSAFNYVNEAYALAAIAATIRSTSLPVLPSMTAITAVPTLEVAEAGKDTKNAPNGQQSQLQSNGQTRRAEGIAGPGVEKKKTSGHNTTVGEETTTAAEKGIAMRFDLEARTTRTGLTPLELALRCGDVIAARLLLFYGAMPPFLRCVNGLQTRLARACSLGDVVSVERLLDMGDSVTQISTDGRYTLVHYAAGQPAVLRYLVQRGLSLETQNAFGETALASLIRHGTGRNAEYAIRETPQLADAAKLATLPSCAVRNYILTPLPPLVGMGNGGVGNATGGAASNTAGGKAKGAASSGRGGGGGSNSAGQHHHNINANAVGDASTSGAAVPHRIGGPETWPWWSFTSLPTIDLIHNLIEAGADVNGLSNNYDTTTTSTMQNANYDGSMATGSTLYNTRTSPAFAPSDLHGDDGISEDEERFFYGQVRRSIVIANESENDRLIISPEDRDSAALEVVRVRDIAAAQQQQVNGGTAATSQPRLVVNPPLSMTPLMYAIVGYHPELIRKLVLEYHAAVMARDSQGACALHYAAMCRHASVMSFLLSAPVLALTSGATTNTNATASSLNGTAMPAETEIDINATDNAGRTPLHYAAAKANVAVVALLLAQGTALQANRPDQHGLTPLHVAVQANHINVVELLVRHCDALFGAWPGMTSNISSTPLGIASGNNNSSFFAGLTTTASNASVNSSNNNGYSNASPNVQASSVRRSNRPFGRSGAGNSPGTSALSSMTGPGQGRTTRSMSASSRSLSPGGGIGGPAGAMMMMLSGNSNSAAAAAALAMASNEYTLVDPESRDTEEQATALEMAIKQRRSAEIVRLLLCEAHASHQIDSGLSNGGSLLHRAVWDGELLYVRLLLDHFANPNEVDNADCTPLMLAIRQTSFVHVNAETGASHTITGPAATTLSVQMIEALLQAGAAPQLQSAVSLDTALHAAARRGERDILYRVFHDPSAFARRMTNMSEHVFFAHTGANTGLQRKSSHHNNCYNSSTSNPNIMDGNAPQQQQLLADGVTRSLSQSETTLPTQTNTAHGSLVGRKARERLEQRRRLAAETESRGEHMNGYSSPSESEPSKASLASQQQYHRRHSSIPYKSEGGEYMNQTQPYKGNNEENGEEAGYGDATRPSFTQRGSNGSSSYEGEHEFALMLLRPRSTFCITDAAARTPLHLLCAHSDATRQQHVLPFIKELVLCPTATMMYPTTNVGVADKERDECVALCEMMDAKGRTALHEACLALFVEAIEVLLAASPQLVGFVDAEGHTPLHDCVRGASDIAQCAVLSEESNNTNNSEACETGTGNTPARVTRAIALLHDAVQRCSPLTLRGFPAPFTAFTTAATGCGAHNASSESASVVAASVMKYKRAARTPYSEVCKVAQHVTITSLLKAGELRGVAQRPNSVTSIGHDSKAATIHTRGGTNVVQCWSDYANLTDSHARTALLLAGEVGHIAAARQLLQLAQQQ